MTFKNIKYHHLKPHFQILISHLEFSSRNSQSQKAICMNNTKYIQIRLGMANLV